MKFNLFWIRVQRVLKIRMLGMGQLARHLQISEETLRNWIYWQNIPDVLIACSISELLGVSVEYLVTGEEVRSEKSSLGPEILDLIQNFKLLGEDDRKMIIEIINMFRNR